MRVDGNIADIGPNGVTELVDQLIAGGCEIMAIGAGYCLDEPQDPGQWETMRAVLKKFGPRHHLKREIVAYLRRLGRVVNV